MIDNRVIIEKLLDQARKCARHDVNLYRIRAYRTAAAAIGRLERPVAEMVMADAEALKRLPGIGRHLAEVIEHFVLTGEWQTFHEMHASAS